MSTTPEVRYYPAGKGWWGYIVYLHGRPRNGAECRTRAAAEKDAQATVRRLKAEAEKNVKEESV